MRIDTFPVALAVAEHVSEELADLAARTRAAVVEVSDGRGAGAGTIWSSDGLIVTNHHVVPGESARVTTEDGVTRDASVVTALPDRDLSLLRVDATGLPHLVSADISRLRPGELMMAVGHPFGVRGAVTLGVFSGVGPIEERRGKHFTESIIANIELRPGNSGGPLVNAQGELVGINSMVLGSGTALAVPVTVVERLVKATTRRTFGVRAVMVAVPAEWTSVANGRQESVMVVEVVGNSAAERSGLLPGDMILAVDSLPVEEPGDLAWILAGTTSQGVAVSILRAGRQLTIMVELV